MPKLSPAARNARRREILDAARRCFARRGFSATTIADLCEESGVSAGGIYTHFENKHAIAAAIGGDATETAQENSDLASLGRRLLSDDGRIDAQLDLQLWAESLHDPVLYEMVIASMDRFRTAVASGVSAADAGDDARAASVEALVLGAEVQRALGRPIDPQALTDAVERLMDATAPDR